MYIIEYQKLEVGDIILTAETTFRSKTVRAFTWSGYSHAMVWVGGTFIHSDGGGVYSKSAQRILFKKRSHVKVLRLKKKLSPLQSAQLVGYARSLVGTVYSLREAVAVKIPKRPPVTEKQFCSRLVAQSYSKAGIKIVENFDYCSPEEINKCSLLDEVSDCIKIANVHEVEFLKSRDPNQETQDDTIKMLIQIRDKFGKNLQTIENIIEFIIKNPIHDKEVTQIALASGYFNHAEVDMEVNPWRYNEGELIKMARLSGKGILPLAQFIHDVGISSAQIHMAELKKNEILFNLYRLNFLKEHVKLYKRLTNTHNLRQDLACNIFEMMKSNQIF